MNIKKLITKYVIFLLVYTVIVRFLKPYGMNLYYTMHPNPDMIEQTYKTLQSIMLATTFFINLILTVFILVDSKKKKLIDWLVAIITFFSAETGIVIFLFWQTYKELSKKYNA